LNVEFFDLRSHPKNKPPHYNPATIKMGGGTTSTDSGHSAKVSHGRGGAGNIAPSDASPSLEPLSTPTLKSQVYTTGRGGTGNMAKNDDADMTRIAQDIDVPPQRLTEGPVHVGRGGGGNVQILSTDEADANREYNRRASQERIGDANANKDKSNKGLADRGKDFLLGKIRS